MSPGYLPIKRQENLQMKIPVVRKLRMKLWTFPGKRTRARGSLQEKISEIESSAVMFFIQREDVKVLWNGHNLIPFTAYFASCS